MSSDKTCTVVELTNTVAHADMGGAYTIIDLNWGILGPIIVNALATIGALAYTFGVVNQRINTVERDLERVHTDVGIIREKANATDERITNMALILERISTQMNMLLTAANDSRTCPYFKNAIRATNNEALSYDASAS